MFPKWFAAIKIAGELLKLALQFPGLLREIKKNQKQKRKYQRQVKYQQKIQNYQNKDKKQ